MKYIGFVPAKGRSVGLPGKNTINLLGKPLLAWSIEAGVKAKLVDDVWVSSDSEQIGKISTQAGAKFILRPLELCADDVTTDKVIRHAIPFIHETVGTGDFGIVLLQPTSPLRTALDVDEAIQLFENSEADSLVSVYPADKSLLKAYKKDDTGFLVGAFSPDTPYQPRQTLPEIYLPNGAIYIFRQSAFLAADCIPRTKVLPFIMEESRSADIDTQSDLETAKIYMESHHEYSA